MKLSLSPQDEAIHRALRAEAGPWDLLLAKTLAIAAGLVPPPPTHDPKPLYLRQAVTIRSVPELSQALRDILNETT